MKIKFQFFEIFTLIEDSIFHYKIINYLPPNVVVQNFKIIPNYPINHNYMVNLKFQAHFQCLGSQIPFTILKFFIGSIEGYILETFIFH